MKKRKGKTKKDSIEEEEKRIAYERRVDEAWEQIMSRNVNYITKD